MKVYELLIIFVLISYYVSDSVQTGSKEDLIYSDNSANNYNYISDIIIRYKRQDTKSGVPCEIPPNPLHATYTILGSSEANYRSGDFVNEFSVLEIHCTAGYAISPLERNISICINGRWTLSPTTCIRTCTSLISTKTTKVTCRFNNNLLQNCINPVVGTIALLSCNPLYEEPNIQRNPVRVCRGNRWDPSTTTCYPICGVKHPKGTTNIIGGENVTVGDYPWQIGIYKRTTKEFLCGGSIIEANIVLTAAHCLTDYEGNVQPVATYMIGAGKYFSRYDEPRDMFAQYSNVLTIHVPDRYTGRINSFAQDIAVMILSVPFTLSEAVQPVCIELNEDPSHLHFLSESNNGVVTGWGYTLEIGVPSDVLKELIIPIVPFHKCSSEVPENFRRYITADKICGGYLNNGTSICRGDSGGALVFKNLLNDRYFAKGIVSTSPATEALTCDSNQYSLYTSVDQHIEFVRDLVALNQYRTPIECAEDCENEEIRENKGADCLIPPNPVNGKYSPYNHIGEYTYTPGTYLSSMSVLTLSCDSGYEAKPSGSTQFVCGGESQWSPQPGICTRTNETFSVTTPRSNPPAISRRTPHHTYPTLPQTRSRFPELTSRPADTCDMSYDAISIIRGEIFIFKDRYFWRINDNGIIGGYPVQITRLFSKLPSNLTHIDAVYEQPNKKVIFFIGKEYFVFNGNMLESEYPRPLEDLGLPPTLEKIDAAMVWGHNEKTYFFSGDLFWRFDDDLMRVELDYPRSILMWKGIGTNIDAAFKWNDGKTYFFKGKGFWIFNDTTMEVENHNQTLSAPFWMRCPSNLEV